MKSDEPQTLFEAPGFYRLFQRADDRLELEVICGTIASYVVRRTLTEEETARVRDFGEFAARALALRVARSGGGV